MYENLGNFSSHYYELPGYTFLTKVIGFAVYNASDISQGTSSNTRLNITLLGEPIKVEFSQEEGKNNNDSKVNDKLKKCVRFDPLNGVVELANMSRPNVCLSKSVGHFVIAMPNVNQTQMVSPSSSPSPSPSPSSLSSPSSLGRRRETKKNTISLWLWWVIGFAGGIVGLMLLGFCFIIGYKTFVSQKIRKMERNSLESESLDIKWIGNSKFPLAPVSRTQAVLENDLAP
ncbi:hypothetical protein RDABS01_007983 [Bienertia sinuspersici]